ncbi:hypothetical protein Hanom_Chr01g00050761 [Helianthus anomalus]
MTLLCPMSDDELIRFGLTMFIIYHLLLFIESICIVSSVLLCKLNIYYSKNIHKSN